MMQSLTAPELAAWLENVVRPNPVLLDVREPWEFQTCHINGSLPMPMNTIPKQAVRPGRGASDYLHLPPRGGAVCKSRCFWNSMVLPRFIT
jgi:rhodanese-related sulfurtransferase